MKRASYREAVRWIAWNDEAGCIDDGIDEIAGLVSACLVADLFGVDPERVARDVLRVRDAERNAPAVGR